MRRLTRPALDAATAAALAALQATVTSAADRRAKAVALWNSKSSAQHRATFDVVRAKLQEMAAGRTRCMYCEDSLGTDIEHFYPKAQHPERAFTWTNYLLACSHCNSNLKRELFPLLNGQPALIDPSSDDPAQHLSFLPSTGALVAIGPKGQPSIDVFALNDPKAPRKLPSARKGAFLKLQLLIEEYDRALTAQEHDAAELAKQTVREEPFPGVLSWLLALASNPAAQSLLRPTIPALLHKHAVETWYTA